MDIRCGARVAGTLIALGVLVACGREPAVEEERIVTAVIDQQQAEAIQQAEEYARQLETASQQMDHTARQLERGDQQQQRMEGILARNEQQIERMEDLTKRWQKQADRYDRVLDLWERNAAAGYDARAPSPRKELAAMSLTVTSTAFAANGKIPKRYTCEGQDISPPIAWSGAPAGTKSFVLIVDDPDAPDPAAPKRVWVHWVLYNLPASAASLAEGATPPQGTLEGLNDWKRTGYGGPCPPVGRHRYFHKLYALDALLPDLKQPTKAQLLQAMEGHVLAEVQLIGTYQKGDKE